MAGGECSRPRQACDGAGALDARRQGLRRQLELAHDRNRALCPGDGAPVPHGGEAAGAEPAVSPAGCPQVQAPCPARRPARVVLETLVIKPAHNFPLPLRERKKNHWVSGAVATLNPLIFQVRGELGHTHPSPAKSKHLASLALRQVQDFASSPSRGEEKRPITIRSSC